MMGVAMRSGLLQAALCIVFGASAFGCGDRSASEATSSPAPARSTTTPPLPVSASTGGRDVVAYVSELEVRRGRVVGETDERFTIAYGRPDRGGHHPRREVPRADVCGVTDHSPAVGEIAACDLGKGRWVPCRVEQLGGASVAVIDHERQRHQLSAEAVVGLSKPLQTRLRAEMERHAERRRLEASFAKTRPVAPDRWVPAVGSRVLARRLADSWYPAKVVKGPDGGKVRVAWELTQWGEQAMMPVDLAPITTDAASIRAGDFLLVPPEGDDPKARWELRRVEGASPPKLTRLDGTTPAGTPRAMVVFRAPDL